MPLDPIHAFYCRKDYLSLAQSCKVKSGGICARCGGVFDLNELRPHHKIELTLDNNAVYELANARYVDNIIIDNNKTIDPIDFSGYRLYTKVALYYDGKLFKTLPISEKIITLDGDGKNTKIKLGFKKILLTEVIKN